MAPELIIAIVIGIALTLYAVLGGADFGAGIWEFHTAFSADERERRAIFRAIGPVWEANHVWLIFAIVLTLNAFPAALAGVSRALWLPLMFALLGIVFRGSAYAFRSYSTGNRTFASLWRIVFAVASALAPFFLGASCGAIAAGQLAIDVDGGFGGSFLTSWLSPLSLFTAFYAVGICSYVSAIYLARETHHAGEPDLAAIWRRRSIAVGAWMGIMSLAGLVLVAIDVPLLYRGFADRGWPLILVSMAAGFAALWMVVSRRYNLAVVASTAAVASVLAGWFAAQYPAIIPPAITVENSHAPRNVLNLMLVALAFGSVVLVPSLIYLFVLFKKADAIAAEKGETS